MEQVEAEQKENEALRLDGPTLEEYVAAGYPAEQYPPKGYAKVTGGLGHGYGDPKVQRNAIGFPIYEGPKSSGIGLGHSK